MVKCYLKVCNLQNSFHVWTFAFMCHFMFAMYNNSNNEPFNHWVPIDRCIGTDGFVVNMMWTKKMQITA